MAKRSGIEVEPYGDTEVWVSVRGVSRQPNQAEVRMSVAHARKLALDLLHAASIQQIHVENLAIQKKNRTRGA